MKLLPSPSSGVFRTVNNFTSNFIVPDVIDDSVVCRSGTSKYRGVSWTCHRRRIIKMVVSEVKALIDQLFEPIFSIAVSETCQVVVAHLVNNDPYHQFGFLIGKNLSLQLKGKANTEEDHWNIFHKLKN